MHNTLYIGGVTAGSLRLAEAEAEEKRVHRHHHHRLGSKQYHRSVGLGTEPGILAVLLVLAVYWS